MKTLFRLPDKIGWRDQVIGLALAAVYVTWLLTTARSVGFPRDEGFYFRAATSYAGWFQLFFEHPSEAMKRQAVDSMWGYNHEHPALMKSLFSLSWMYLHEKWKVFTDASTAMRFPAMVMAGIACWVTYLFGARAYSRRAGLIAATLFALMPRVFFHAHLASFDVPITAMWTLCIYVYWRAQQRGGLLFPVLAGLVYGLTLETKHNAWILPAVFLPHALFDACRALLPKSRTPMRFPWSLFSMAIIGPAVLYALWPWMWFDTKLRLEEWANFHLRHEYYNMEFLGRNYFGPPSPRSYMPLMIVATVPAITLFLFFIGSFERLRYLVRRLSAWVSRLLDKSDVAFDSIVRGAIEAERHEVDLLFALAFCAAVAPWLRSSTPIFGGTKHWMPAYPFLALFAGRGFDYVATAMERALAERAVVVRRVAQAALAAAIVAAPLAITIHSHPFGLETYVPLVGGTPGAADLGLNRQFWGYTTQNAAEWLAANAPPNATIFIHDTAWDSWNQMQQEHRVRSDLRAVGSPGDAQIALIQHELHMAEVEYQVWVAFGTQSPAYVITDDGVPIVSIYKRP